MTDVTKTASTESCQTASTESTTQESRIKQTYMTNEKGNYFCVLSLREEPKLELGRAPWMEVAIREAKQWAGQKESVITKVDNYFKLVSKTSMTLTSNAWCAAFVNYCLQEVGYDKSNNPFGALAFRYDKHFIQIDEPLYGAIATIVTDKQKGFGHVNLVLGLIEGQKDRVFLLGGNQSDEVGVCNRPISKAYKYYLPIKYTTNMTTEKLPILTEQQILAMGLQFTGSGTR